MGKLKQNLSNDEQNRLLSTLLQVVKALPDIVRQPRLQIAGLADATNLARFAQLQCEELPLCFMHGCSRFVLV